MDIPKLESFIFEKMAATRLPGLSLALVQGEEVVYARGFGQADLARGRGAVVETLYGAASITKSFVAIAVLQLVEKGLLRLSDPVENYVPWPPGVAGGTVRIEHLLSHTSGLPALGYIEAVLRHAHGIGGRHLPIGSPADVVAFMRGAEGWGECPPGERWFYLNEGYALLGEIIGRLAGMPYERYIHENILRPLEMSRSFFAEADVAGDGEAAIPYVLPRGGQPRAGRYLYGTMGGDAALITNVLDLSRYVKMFLQRGRGVLSKASFEEMIRPRIDVPAKPVPGWFGDSDAPQPAQYGFGLSTSQFLGQALIGHSGSLIVSTGYMGFMPEANIGVAVLTNASGYPMAQLAKVALAGMLGHAPDTLPFVRMDKILTELAGQYESFQGTIRAQVVRAGDFLRIEYEYPDQPPPAVVLVPERLGGERLQFFTYSDGQRLEVEFRRGGAEVELIYERYKLRRVGK